VSIVYVKFSPVDRKIDLNRSVHSFMYIVDPRILSIAVKRCPLCTGCEQSILRARCKVKFGVKGSDNMLYRMLGWVLLSCQRGLVSA
jgi:hypothetical protein